MGRACGIHHRRRLRWRKEASVTSPLLHLEKMKRKNWSMSQGRRSFPRDLVAPLLRKHRFS